MNRFHEFSIKHEFVTRSLIIIVSSVIGSIGLNMFLIPANVFSAGVNGVAQLVSGFLSMNFNLSIDTGILIFLLNIPIFLIGWIKLGAKATIYSFFSVLAFSLFALIIPVQEIIQDPLLNSIIGGILIGIGSAYCLKYGFTTGGFDLLSVIISKVTGKSVGSMMFMMNLLVIAGAGFLYDWKQAIYTIISIYALSIVVDKIYTSGHKLTVFIVTGKEQEVLDVFKKNIIRGVTVLPGKGGYSGVDRSLLMVVVNRYELYDIEKLLHSVDENAFVNVIATEVVLGEFWTQEQQKAAFALAKGQTE
ncbi:YitT family protein [Vagococcus xieshaowenii]|uniref:YitT family protein n=1 Tax=Vagococcus xieshaowenii TaxID=2562451 RepID=A0AAJ5EF52_9ENTE|nr:YitT family protein [Vagococcus xieshaowenii]QCA28613.1 YitT family protein [Vagococcus xieshaowenii]TFZ40579.1 YitT family protein [Vagococcus xieshaowenii]